jgi:hypothetical protein
MLKISYIAVRPEHVEGRMAKYDTVSGREGNHTMNYSGRLKKVVTLSTGEGSHGLEILRFAQNDSYKNVTLLKSFTIIVILSYSCLKS